MSMHVPNTFQVKYRNNVEMVVQQQGNPLEAAVTVQDDNSTEKVKVKDLVGNNEAKEAGERHGDTKYNDTPYDGVWIPKKPELYDAALIDNADKLATAIDLQGTEVTTHAGTINRARTRRILQGFYGPIISGKEGLTSTSFPGAQVIPVTEGGASGAQKINVAKLIAADKLLTQGFAIPENAQGIQKFMVLTADDNAQLLTEVPATSSDFKASYAGVVQEGKLRALLGWTFIHMELDNPLLTDIPDLATDGSGYRKTPFWVKGGVVLNYWQRLRSMIDRLPQKMGSVQVFSGTTCAATRTQAPMSGVILNQKG